MPVHPASPDAQVALVTGAGSGIGRAIAHRLGAGGARVICTDIDLDGAQSIAGEIEEAGGSALAFRMDISCETSVRDTVAGALAETGHLNAVAANAGIMVEGDLLSLSLDD